MRRGMLLCTVVLAAIAWTPGAATAGGGCHSGATQADETGEDEATVRMIDACYTASVTQVDPGTAVTFVNDDVGITHNVGGTGWGHFDDMIEGDAFTARFDDAGVYPFACSYHPSMTGAIVVGDGKGAGNGSTVAVDAFEPPSEPTVAPLASERSSAVWWIAAAGLLGVGIGAGAGLARSRFRARVA
jgi:plastocyanin